MAVVKNLMVRAGFDASSMTKGTKQAQKTMTEFQSSINGSLRMIKNALITLGVGKFIKDATKSAVGFESAFNQIGRTLGNNAGEFRDWVNNQASVYGMAKSEAYKYGAIYSNLTSGFTKDTAQTVEYTENLLKASAVVASGTGRTMEDTMERIRSGLLGNTEAIEDLGINVNVAMIESTKAFQQFANGRSWQQLAFQEQQQIRYMAIIEQATVKYGDTLANTTATRQLMFTSSLKNCQLALGQAFLPIYNIILPALTSFANSLASVLNLVAQFMNAIFGTSQSSAGGGVSTVNQMTAANNELADSYADTGKAAKKAQGFLAGFDEVNNVSKEDDSSSGGGGGSNPAGGGVDTSKGLIGGIGESTVIISKQVQEMADLVKLKILEIKEFMKDLAITIANSDAFNILKDGALSAFNIISAASIEFYNSSLLPFVLWIRDGVIIPIINSIAEIAPKLAQMQSDTFNILANMLADNLKFVGEFITNFIMPIGDAVVGLIPAFLELLVGIGNILNDLLNLVRSTQENLIKVIINPALELIKTIVIEFLLILKNLWDKYGKILIDNIRNFIKGIQETMQLLWDNVLNPIIKPFLEMLTWLWEKHLKGLVEQVGEFIMKCVNGALELYNGFIKPIVDWLVITLGPTFAAVINYIVDVFGTFIAIISDIVKSILRVLGGIIDFVVGVFTGNWGKAWQGIVDVFGGIVDLISGIFKGVLNATIDVINFAVRGVIAAINGLIQGAIYLINKIPGVDISLNPISAPQIPKLARGGIVNSPTTALIGEAGAEMVVPLENTSFVDKLASALGTAVMSAMQFSNNSSNNSNSGDIYLQVDGTTFARVINPYAAKENERLGNRMIIKTV
ncbi:MAG: hypothetical protein RR891_07655 [Clostridium sp.]